MREICQSEQVNLVVPTIDTELPVYAGNCRLFEEIGVRLSVSSLETVAIGSDKVLTNRWLQGNGFETVRQWSGPEQKAEVAAFPVIVKPRFGSASIGVSQANDREELQILVRKMKDPVIEEKACGDEYTVNLLVGRDGLVLSAVPHRRLEVRSGEVSKGVTTKDPRLLDLAKRLGESLPGAFGALNFQCILDRDGAFRIFEINPRFGGGYPLAHQAGADFPRWLIEEVLGLTSTASFAGWEDGLAMLRYDDAVFVRREAID